MVNDKIEGSKFLKPVSFQKCYLCVSKYIYGLQWINSILYMSYIYVYIPQMVLQISYVLAAICITLKDVTSLQTTCPLPDLLDFQPLNFSSPGMTSLLPHPDTPKSFLQFHTDYNLYWLLPSLLLLFFTAFQMLLSSRVIYSCFFSCLCGFMLVLLSFW